MAKSNKNESRVSSEQEIAARKEQLAAEMAKLDAEMNAARETLLKAIEQKIIGLPEHFGVATLDDVRNLIAKHQKGILFVETHGNVGDRAPRKSLSEEEKAKLIEARKGGAQYSALSAQFGVSVQTVFNYCKAAGITTARGAGDSDTAPQA
jgi:hypothetical protein